jgi:glycine hydroxymethyltransferase
VTSGLRIGTPAITTRGFGVEESRQVGDLVADVLDAMGDESALRRVREAVVTLCRRHPVYA